MQTPKKVTGIFSGMPLIDVGTQQLDFGRVQVNERRSRDLEVTNKGRERLVVSSITSSNIDEFNTSPSSFSLERGTSRKIAATFAPKTPGDKAGTLTIQHNLAPETETTPISVRGEGIQHQIPKLDPAHWNFEAVDVDDTVEKTLVVTNSDSSVTIDVGEVEWTAREHFSVSPTRLTLAPLQKGSLTITFRPRSSGPKRTAVTLPYTAGSESSALQAELEGEALEIDVDTVLNYVGQILGLILAIAGTFELMRRVVPTIRQKLAKGSTGDEPE